VLPLFVAVVILSLIGGMLSLAAATKAFSGKGPWTLLTGMCSLSWQYLQILENKTNKILENHGLC
jgi:hypothetical protein